MGKKEQTGHYKGYYVTLRIKENELLGDIKESFDDETLYMADIHIEKDGKEYNFENYYIKGPEDIEAGNAIAKKIVERMDEITFINSKFIGKIVVVNDEVIVADDSSISLELKKREIDTRHPKLVTEEEDLYQKYLAYQKLRNQPDKNLLLKYAAHFELQFRTHTIPDLIKKLFLDEERSKGSIEYIIDYSELDEILRSKLDGSVALFQERLSNMEDNYNRMDRFNEIMNNAIRCTDIYEQAIQIINEFLKKIKEHSTAKKKESVLIEEIKKISVFNPKRGELNHSLQEVRQQLNFNEKDESIVTKGLILSRFMDSINKTHIIIDNMNFKIEKCKKMWKEQETAYKEGRITREEYDRLRIQYEEYIEGLIRYIQKLERYVAKIEEELNVIKNLTSIEAMKIEITNYIIKTNDEQTRAKASYEKVLAEEQKYNPDISFDTLGEHIYQLSNGELKTHPIEISRINAK